METTADTPEALDARLEEIGAGSWRTQALYVAARLNLADLLAGGPRTSEELAREAGGDGGGAHAPSLRRLLRALTTLEIVRERDDGSFELLPLGALLRSDVPGSRRAWALLVGGMQWQTWGHLLESVRTGRSARSLLQGTEGFEHLERDPEQAAVFNQAMVDLTRRVAPAVLRAYDFSSCGRIVDVGGGYGEFLSAILAAHAGARGVLFDLEHAIEGGRRLLETAGVADRCEFLVGSFFESIPAGADAYVLKSIVHDWNDERAGVLLSACRRATTPGAKLLLVERIMPERLGASATDQVVARSDLNMLVSLGARERTEAEFASLLASAGFRLTRVVPATLGFHVVEAVPA